MIMNIVVFGASGKVGRLVVNRLIEQNHKVTAFVHKNNPFEANKRLMIMKGNIYSQEDIDKAIKGCNIVISTLGSWNTPKKNILTSGMEIIIPSMKKHNINRIITLTGADAQSKQDKISPTSLMTHFIFGLIARKVLIDGERHLQILEASDLNWTTIRSPRMRNSDSSGKYLLDFNYPKPWQSVSRRDVAKAICDLVDNKGFLGKSPFIHSVY
jgi:putative NADH-flavin reductase